MFKRKLIFIIISLFISISPVIAKKFDFSQTQGLSLGMSKDKAFAKLKKDSIEYEIRDNETGGKYYAFNPSSSIVDFPITEIRMQISNNKIKGFILDIGTVTLIDITDELAKISNCNDEDYESGKYYYYFDNCTISVNLVSETLSIFGYIQKCKN